MLQELPTIYRAKNLLEARLLCNILEEEGIRATVANGVLENGSGVDLVGWPTLARVMVAREDAVRAREIALKYDREVSRGSGGGWEGDRDSRQTTPEAEILEAWPCCPECGARRLTRCAFCGTSGADFPPADANPGDLLDLPTPSADALSRCDCGPGGCGAHEVEAENVAAESVVPLLLCPTCDEPFHPQYLRRCEWCGHEFPDGAENPSTEERIQEPFNWRIAYVIYALILIALAIALYLLCLF